MASSKLSLVLVLALLTVCSSMGGEGVVQVGDYGAVGDGERDDRAAIQSALDAAKEMGPGTTVRFGAGRVYWLGAHKPAFGMLLLSGTKGVTLEGNGATLLAHPSNRILSVYDSEEITVRDFVLDYLPLPFTQGRMSVVDPEKGTVEFRPDSGYAPPVLGNSEVYRDAKGSDCVFVRASGEFTHSWLRLSGITEPSPGLFRCLFHGSPEAVGKQLRRTQVGDSIVIKMLFSGGETLRSPEGRFIATGAASINIAFSRSVTLSGITSYAAPGMTFNAHGSEGVVLDHCSVVRKPGTDRLVAGQSDGFHAKSLTIMPRVLDCRFEALMDDSINIKISSEMVKRVEGNRVLVSHGDIVYNDCVVRPGDEMELYDYDGRKHLGFGTVTAVERVGYREVWIIFSAPPAGLEPGDLLYHRPVTPAEVRGCQFGSQLKTALILRPPGTVADCVFDDVSYGVHAFVNGPIEGCMPREIRVDSCTFRHNEIAALALAIPSPQAAPPSEFTLQATNCRFVLGRNRGCLLSASNANGIRLDGCSATIEDGRSGQELLRVRGCTEVDIGGVDWE